MTDLTPPTPPTPPAPPAKNPKAEEILADARHTPIDPNMIARREGRPTADERAALTDTELKYYVAEGRSVNVPMPDASGVTVIQSALPGEFIAEQEECGDDFDGFRLPRKRIAQLVANGFLRIIGEGGDDIEGKIRADQETLMVRRRQVVRRSKFAYDPEFLLGKTYDDLVQMILTASKGNMSPPENKEECIRILSEDFGKAPTV